MHYGAGGSNFFLFLYSSLIAFLTYFQLSRLVLHGIVTFLYSSTFLLYILTVYHNVKLCFDSTILYVNRALWWCINRSNGFLTVTHQGSQIYLQYFLPFLPHIANVSNKLLNLLNLFRTIALLCIVKLCFDTAFLYVNRVLWWCRNRSNGFLTVMHQVSQI